jgi:hypothetical protein
MNLLTFSWQLSLFSASWQSFVSAARQNNTQTVYSKIDPQSMA